MVFLYYAMPYHLNNDDIFQFINGQLYPIKGTFTEETPSQPIWYWHLGV